MRNILNSAVGYLYVRLEPAHGKRPARIRILIQEERDVRLAFRAGKHYGCRRFEVLFSGLVEDTFHREGVFDSEESELGAELRARRPEVTQTFDNLRYRFALSLVPGSLIAKIYEPL